MSAHSRTGCALVLEADLHLPDVTVCPGPSVWSRITEMWGKEIKSEAEGEQVARSDVSLCGKVQSVVSTQEMRLFLVACDFLYVERLSERSRTARLQSVCVCVFILPFPCVSSELTVSQCFLQTAAIPFQYGEPGERRSWTQASSSKTGATRNCWSNSALHKVKS